MKELLIWLVLAQTGDITTTGIARSEGCHEIAPLYRDLSFPALVGIKGGSTVYLTFYFGNSKPTKWKKWLVGGVAASATAATAWNARQIPRCSRR